MGIELVVGRNSYWDLRMFDGVVVELDMSLRVERQRRNSLLLP